MTRKTWFAVGGGLASVAALAGAFALAYADPPANPPPRDLTKRRIERPAEDVLARLIAAQKAAEAARADAEAARAAAEKGFVNPKVAPGKVTWHKDLATATKASARTGRPVLLFQMMGHLDDKFC
jgi:hypothetical protein